MGSGGNKASDEFRVAANKMVETSEVAMFASAGGYRPVVNAILKAAKRGENKVVVDVSTMGDCARRSLMKTLSGMGLQAGGGTVRGREVTHVSGITSWYSVE